MKGTKLGKEEENDYETFLEGKCHYLQKYYLHKNPQR